MNTAEALRELMDGRWAQLREEARRDLPAILFEPVADLTTEQHRERVLAELLELGRSGLTGRGFPVQYGGAGDIGGSVVSIEMLGFADLSLMVKAGVQWGLFGGAVQALGTAGHHAAYLPSIISGELLGCFAMTETGHGSDVAMLQTTATYDVESGEFVVSTPDDQARKDYIGNAARDGRVAVVFAQLLTGGESHGVHALLVPIRDETGKPLPGIRIEDCGRKSGLNGVDNGRIWFDDVRVPRAALLDRFGQVAADGTYTSPIDNPSRRFFTMLGTLVRGRISVASAAASATKSALTIATRYAETRRQFARPGSAGEVVLLDYATHQRRLLPAIATTYALHFAQQELVESMHDLHGAEVLDERAQRELETRAAGFKAKATWHATQTIQTCREACGGHGYLMSSRLPQLKADTDVFTTFEGDNTVLMQLVAKGLLTGYRNDFGALDTLGTVRFVADQVMGAIVERTAARTLVQRIVDASPRRSEDADLHDRSWQIAAFRDRESHLVDGLARRLRRAGKGDGDAFAAFNAAQPHLLAAADAHVALEALEAFDRAIQRCTDPVAAQLLSRVCDLYALSTIEAERAWFVEHGRLTAARAKAVVKGVEQLCAALRPEARTLVDGFGIPDAWLGSDLVTTKLAGASRS
jgi:acyl-CoA oxidase